MKKCAILIGVKSYAIWGNIPMNDTLFLKNFKFNEYRYKDNKHTDNSAGVDLHFIGYMKEGKAVILSGGQRLELSEGDMFYIPKGCRYHSYWMSDREILFDSIGFLYFPSKSSNGYALQKINYDRELFEQFKPLSDSKELNASSVGRLYTLLGRLEDILLEAPIDSETAVIENLMLLVRQDPNRSMAEYAADCGISESTLYLYVRHVLGKTPNRIRQEALCEKAVRLLTTTNLTVEEICDSVGFSSASYFRKVLFSITGKTPSMLRKEAMLL